MQTGTSALSLRMANNSHNLSIDPMKSVLWGRIPVANSSALHKGISLMLEETPLNVTAEVGSYDRQEGPAHAHLLL